MYEFYYSNDLEDNIGNDEVKSLFNTFIQLESSNDRRLIIDSILRSTNCVNLSEMTLRLYEEANYSISEPLDDVQRFSKSHMALLSKELEMEPTDIAALALVASSSLLQLFVIDNFVGPSSDNTMEQIYKAMPQIYSNLREKIDAKSLRIDGSEAIQMIQNPWLIRTCQLFWTLMQSLDCQRRLREFEFLIQRQRYLTIYQEILVEPTEQLANETKKIQEYLFDHFVLTGLEFRVDSVLLCCELAQSALLRDGITYSRKFLNYASKLSGVSIEHTGVLGRRTKYQQTDVPQLVVKVSNRNHDLRPIVTTNHEDRSDMPKDVILNDDTLLPNISFVGDDGASPLPSTGLGADAQILMLARLDSILKTEVMEESLKDEWTLAYLRSITSSSTIWAVTFKALLLRSSVERKNMRKMDRALLQMEELIRNTEITNPHCDKKLEFFYSVLPPSRWHVQKILGDASYELGLLKNALDIYTRIGSWEGMIRCYASLGQNSKAEKLIRQELDKEETPYLYCMLGDATDDTQYYEKSWTLSKGRFSRAKKSIGTYHYVRKDYAEAVKHYEEALRANPSNLGVLSLLAYCCLTLERWERAAECYRNITYLDDGSFLAWNNLSKAYIKLNQKDRAWKTLREAIKCSYEEWKVWENFMLVSIQVGALDDVIVAWHRLVDLKSSHKDDQILCALTDSLITHGTRKLLDDAIELLGRLAATGECTSRHWLCYFRLLVRRHQLTNYELSVIIQKLTNSLQRATPRVTGKSLGEIESAIDDYLEIIDCFLYAIDIFGPRDEIWKQFKNFKLSVTNTRKLFELKGPTLEFK